MAVLFGVKVTLWLEIPVLGVAPGEVKEKLPATLAEPPDRLELERLWP